MATTLNSSLFSFFFLIQLIVHLSAGGGFTVDLIHRDSPQSPFYNSSVSRTDRLTNALRRSFTRASHFNKKQNTHYYSPTNNIQSGDDIAPTPSNNIQAEIIPATGEYLMNISIGTPRFEVLAIADTGSDLVWTQCKPCADCFRQNAPLFDPAQSSTYRALQCQTRGCQSLDSGSRSCKEDNNICEYTMSYGDRSNSRGDLAVDTFTYGSTSGRALPVPNTVFGCGYSNSGSFNELTSGIIGLGGGPLSIVRQLSGTINGKFSYCLVGFESNSTSKIKFGEDVVANGSGVVSTPLVQGKVDTYYYLTLESVSVGSKSLAYKKTKLPSEAEAEPGYEEGNMIIDSGTTLTFLLADVYDRLENELANSINKESTQDPQGLLSLCYSDTDIDIPTLTFNFRGAEVVLLPSRTFIRNGDLVCLAMVPTNNSFGIFGNLAQKNFLIGYDLENSVLSFKPTDCGKQ